MGPGPVGLSNVEAHIPFRGTARAPCRCGGLRTALIASAAGLLIAAAATRLIADLRLEVSPRDPAVFAAVAAGVVAVAILASLWPAMRASRVDPAEALRSE